MTALPPPDVDFTGKCVIVIGANTGIGLEASRTFVRLNAAKVVLGCRDTEKGEQARKNIEESTAAATVTGGSSSPSSHVYHGSRPTDNSSSSSSRSQRTSNHDSREKQESPVVQVWHIDLSSFDSVRSFCHRAATELDRLDVVVLNAGLYTMKHELFEGYERQTTVHIITTYLAALLLLPTLRRTSTEYYRYPDAPHISIVGSNAHLYETQPLGMGGSESQEGRPVFEELRGDAMMTCRHSTTKLLSVLVMRELARRMKVGAKDRVVLNMPEPGICQTSLCRRRGEGRPTLLTGLSQKMIARTAEMGSRTYIHAAAGGWDTHGKYLEDCKISAPSDFADTPEGKQLQKDVWDELLFILESIEPGISENI